MLSCFIRVRLCDPVDCSPPGSSLYGILQAGILEWAALPSSRGSPTLYAHLLGKEGSNNLKRVGDCSQCGAESGMQVRVCCVLRWESAWPLVGHVAVTVVLRWVSSGLMPDAGARPFLARILVCIPRHGICISRQMAFSLHRLTLEPGTPFPLPSPPPS